MKIAICDDEIEERKKIMEYLIRYSKENMLDLETTEFSGGSELLAVFEKSLYKVIFLDIFMGDVSGVDTALQIRALDEDCAIIFTTTSPDFRAEGFEVGAAHYLVKPVDYEGIETAMNRCKRMFTEDERSFTIPLERHSVRVRMKDVIYIEVFGKNVLVHTTDETLETRMALADMEQLLSGDPFLRCHRCYIVNMSMVMNVLEQEFLMKNNEKIPIRKNGRKETKDSYDEYLFRSVRRDFNG